MSIPNVSQASSNINEIPTDQEVKATDQASEKTNTAAQRAFIFYLGMGFSAALSIFITGIAILNPWWISVGAVILAVGGIFMFIILGNNAQNDGQAQ